MVKDKKNNIKDICDCKYIFVVGGVISGVGKGVAASSIGKILSDRGKRVTSMKIDPYINIDAGTMNPTEHGEVFVLDDGDETDQDMGNYERFIGTDLSHINYMTTGRVYQSVIERERNLSYGGACVQVVPHIPLEVIRRIEKARDNAKADVVIIEIGGTVGEYENILFLEAARMMKIKNPKSVFFVMVSYLPIPSKVGEMKTKPTQHAVRTLNASGIQPDIIIARSNLPLDDKRKEKLSMFCNISQDRVISAPDVDSIYDIPLNFEKEGLSDIICETMGMTCDIMPSPSFIDWTKFAKSAHTAKKELKIAVVGKYFATGDFTLSDSYLSVIEAIKYSCYKEGRKPVLTWISSTDFEKNPKSVKILKDYDGVIVPGGFGSRGIEGILMAIKYVRENNIPYLGLCYGMQLMIIEYARNVLKISDAHTLEINSKSKNLVITIMEEQKEKIENKKMGGSMRLGAYPAIVKKGTVAYKAYGKEEISERHRHRYEVNPLYVDRLEKAGLVFSAKSKDGVLCEIAELPFSKHPFFLGSQFHPEFKAQPLKPHPLFSAFVKACVKLDK
ncbi:TPA: CTP synthase [Candidatus Nomurabacteria bacterium]|nr:MAG: CTP synthetase [Parcubacteria bacterium RAAC4_OD1_1]HCY26331.1 CTP synthase [Candidatus Nomurabacteria bacterium]